MKSLQWPIWVPYLGSWNLEPTPWPPTANCNAVGSEELVDKIGLFQFKCKFFFHGKTGKFKCPTLAGTYQFFVLITQSPSKYQNVQFLVVLYAKVETIFFSDLDKNSLKLFQVYIEVYKVEDDQKRMLYRGEVVKQTKMTWRPFTIQSDDLYGNDGNEWVFVLL